MAARRNPYDPLCEDNKMTATKAKKLCHHNLSVSLKKRRYGISLLRVVMEDELDLVRAVLGSTFGVGLTHSAPTSNGQQRRKDISTVELQTHQTVRIVTCREDDVDLL
jgi:hypothetical protein